MKKNVNETHNFYVENLLDVRRKNHGTVVHSTIHYINVCEYNHVLPVQQPEQNRESSYKELSPTQTTTTREQHKASKPAATKRPQLTKIPASRN